MAISKQYQDVTCKWCKTTGLRWNRYFADNQTKYELLGSDGSKHICNHTTPVVTVRLDSETTYKLEQNTWKPVTEAPESSEPATPKPTLTESTTILETLAKVAETADAAITKADGLVDETKRIVGSGLARAKDEIKSELKDDIKLYAENAIKDLLPQTHIILIKKQDDILRIEGRPHKSLDTLIQITNLRLHTFIVGPAGGGKTTGSYQASVALGLDYYERSMGPNTSEWDLFGFRNADGNYVPGIMRQPFEHGGILMLDEMDNTNPSVLTALNSALSNGKATFPDGKVEKHPDFVCIAAGNTYGRGADRLYVGRNQLDAATLDRFINLTWDYDEEAELDWAGRDQIQWIEYVQRVRAKAQSLSMRVVISPRASINGAKLLRAGIGIEQVKELVLFKGISKDDRGKLNV